MTSVLPFRLGYATKQTEIICLQFWSSSSLIFKKYSFLKAYNKVVHIRERYLNVFLDKHKDIFEILGLYDFADPDTTTKIYSKSC